MLRELAQKEMKNEQMKGHWQFYPKTEEEWKLYMKYDCIKQKLDDIPQYYYKGIGLRYEPYWSHYEAKDENDKTYLIIKDDIKTIFAVLKKY